MWYAGAWAYKFKISTTLSILGNIRIVLSNFSTNKGYINSQKAQKEWHYPNSTQISIIHHDNMTINVTVIIKLKIYTERSIRVCALLPTFKDTYLVLCSTYCSQYPIAHLKLSMPKWMHRNSLANDVTRKLKELHSSCSHNSHTCLPSYTGSFHLHLFQPENYVTLIFQVRYWW